MIPLSGEAAFDAAGYWRRRLQDGPALAATGTRPFGVAYQRHLYLLKEVAIRRVLRPCRGLFHGGRVLDVGCGWGYFEPLFSAMGADEVAGVDFVESAVEQLQGEHPEFEYHAADIAAPLPDALTGRCFELVTAIDMLYHIVDDQAFTAALRNLCALCRPDGGLLLYTDAPGRSGEPRGPTGHCRYRRPSDYQAVFAEFGMTPLRATPMYHLFDTYTPWSQWAARHPRVAWPLMYAVDRLLARFGWRDTANRCYLVRRGTPGRSVAPPPAREAYP